MNTSARIRNIEKRANKNIESKRMKATIQTVVFCRENEDGTIHESIAKADQDPNKRYMRITFKRKP